MIRITQQKNAKSAKRCYSSADYYREGQGIVGSWGGKGESRLGLDGTVDRSPSAGCATTWTQGPEIAVTVQMRSKRTVGYNFKFSVSKSVSLLYAMSGDQAILNAFLAAVDETMREMEGEMKTRVRKAGQDTRPHYWQHGLGGIHPYYFLPVDGFAIRNCRFMFLCST